MDSDVAELVERLEYTAKNGLLQAANDRMYATHEDAASTIRALVAENERLRDEIENGVKYRAAVEAYRAAKDRADAAEAKLCEAEEVMWTLYHAACGPTGFAAAIRATSGVPYPWPALDEADDLARAFLADMEKPRDP